MHALTEREIQNSVRGQIAMDHMRDEDALASTGQPVQYFHTLRKASESRGVVSQTPDIPTPLHAPAIRRDINEEPEVTIVDNRVPYLAEGTSKPHRILINLARQLGTYQVHLSQRGVPIVFAHGAAACWFGGKKKRYVKVFWPSFPATPNKERPKTKVFKASEHPSLVSDVARFMEELAGQSEGCRKGDPECTCY